MNKLTPIFSTSASLKQGGIFTLEKPDPNSTLKNGPISLVSLAKEEKLKEIVLIESNFVNFMNASKRFGETGVQFKYGIKLVVCENMEDKSDKSFENESKVIVLLKDDSDILAYQSFIHIFTKAATDGFYYIPRIDWKNLKSLWHNGLMLALPFYSSFLYKNTLTFSSIVPDFPDKPLLFKEIGQNLPFDSILNKVVDDYANFNKYEVENVKSIYYKNRKDCRQFMINRCILDHNTWDEPHQEYMTSNDFSYESYKELIK